MKSAPQNSFELTTPLKVIFKCLSISLIIAIGIILPTQLNASHFRYGQITWTPDPSTPGKIDFTINTAWRRSAFTSFCSGSCVGTTINHGATFRFGDGGTAPGTAIITSENITDDWIFVTQNVSHTYSSNGNFTAYFQSCCRISGLENGSSGSFRVETIVNINLNDWLNSNTPPNSTLPPVVFGQQGNSPISITIPAFDADGDNLTFRLANSNEIQIPNPPGLSINSNSGILTLQPPNNGFVIGDRYAIGIVIEDGQTKTLLDFILEVTGSSIPPFFTGSTPVNNFIYTVNPGTNVNFTVTADDSDGGSTVFLSATGLPTGVIFNPSLPTSPAPGPVSTVFNWTPTSNDIGSYVIAFAATDNINVQTLTTVVINVSSAPNFVPPSLGNQSFLCISSGPFSQQYQAEDADPNDNVSITSVNINSILPNTPTPIPFTAGGGFPARNSLPPGLSFNPTLPTTAANPTTTTLSGNIVDADWGIYNMELTAQDNFSETSTITNYFIVNRDPFFTPPTVAENATVTAFVGVPFTMTFTADDPDIGLQFDGGDQVAFAQAHAMLPSWVTTFTDDGNGNLTIGGTPMAGDVGSSAARIELHDRTTHFLHIHCSQVFRHFTLDVQNCALPTATCQDIIIQLDGTGNASILASQIDNGSSAPCGLQSMTVSPNAFDCTTLGSQSVTLTVTDINNNVSTCNANVTVEDTGAPTALCQNITIQLDGGTGSATIAPADIDGGSSDGCTFSLAAAPTSFDCSSVGNNTVTLTVTDASNNSNSCNATVTVEDITAPTALCQNITIQLDANGSASITTADINGGSNDACTFSLGATPTSFDCSNVGDNTVTLTVTDASSNSSSCDATVTVQDVTAPTALCQNITVQLDANGSASITAADIDGGSDDPCNFTLAASTTNFDCSNVGPNTVTLTVTDASNNSNSCDATVIVEDVTAPTALCQDITIQLDANGDASITAQDIDGGSDDACGVNSISVDETSFDCEDLGSNLVTLTVSDVNGNTSSCTANVEVEDNIAPTFSCFQSIGKALDANGQATISVADVVNIFSIYDNCDEFEDLNFSISQVNFGCSDVGTQTVTITATDQQGNESLPCNATVIIQDNVSPVALCQDITIQLDANGDAGITAQDIDGGSDDACNFTLAASTTSFDCSNVGPNTVTLTVTDASNNSSSCDATVNGRRCHCPFCSLSGYYYSIRCQWGR